MAWSSSAPTGFPWPASAQRVLGIVLGLACLLLAANWFRLRYATWPTEYLPHPSEVAYRVDLNESPSSELQLVPGLGPILAQRVVEYRQQHGPFRQIEDLTQVKGIGEATLQRLRPWVVIGLSRPLTPLTTPSRDPATFRTPQLVRLERKPTRAPVASGRLAQNVQRVGTPIDINHASAAELERLPGIGKVLAQRIIEERQRARFDSIDAVDRVRGIGPKRLEQIRPLIHIGTE